MEDLTGTIVGGRYRVETFVGRGGMASVYQVWDAQRAAFLAMKVLDSDLADDVVFLRRFKREGQTLESLQHPNIVRFYGLEESDGLAYILMDYIEGLTLRREISLNKKTMRPSRMLQILQPVCAALHYAHQKGMVHCDIKPANILIQRSGMVYLTDFGIARVKGTRTESPTMLGTIPYMPPEQLGGREPTPLADQYALGIVLYEMLTGGERPFKGEKAGVSGDTTQRMIWEKRHQPALPPSRYNPAVMPEMEAVTMRCLERDPEARFPSVLDFLRALDEAVHGDGENYDIQTIAGIPFPSPDLPVDGYRETEPLIEQEHEQPPVLSAQEVKPIAVPTGTPNEPVAPLLLQGNEGDQLPLVEGSIRRVSLRSLAMFLTAAALALAIFLTARQPLAERSLPTATITAPLTDTMITRTLEEAPTVVLPQAALPSATPTIQPTPIPTVTGGEGQIAFASDRSGSVQIWIMNSAQPGEHYQITNIAKGACQPAWSPDGEQLAFITPCNGPRITYPGAKIKIIELATGRISDLPIQGGAFDPDWSPNGTTIAYTTYNGERTEIHGISLATLDTYPLSTRGTRNSHADWSPDGISLLFTSDDNGIDEIWRMRADGASQEVLTNAGLFRAFSKPEWSPDGQSITASMKKLDDPAPLPLPVLLDPNSARAGGKEILTEALRIEDASFSPDGQWLVFWYVVEGNNFEIGRMDRRGSITRLTDHKARDFHPAWCAAP